MAGLSHLAPAEGLLATLAKKLASLCVRKKSDIRVDSVSVKNYIIIYRINHSIHHSSSYIIIGFTTQPVWCNLRTAPLKIATTFLSIYLPYFQYSERKGLQRHTLYNNVLDPAQVMLVSSPSRALQGYTPSDMWECAHSVVTMCTVCMVRYGCRLPSKKHSVSSWHWLGYFLRKKLEQTFLRYLSCPEPDKN